MSGPNTHKSRQLNSCEKEKRVSSPEECVIIDSPEQTAGTSTGKSSSLKGQDENIDWSQSPFFLGNFYTRVDKNSAKCNSCPEKANLIKRTDGNTSGMENHLSRRHPQVFEQFLKKKEEVLKKRQELKSGRESRKRRAQGVVEDLAKTKQMKLSLKGGILDMSAPPPDPKVQQEWDNALVDYLADTYQSFSAVSGQPFRKMVEVINKRSRSKIKVRARKELTKQVDKRAEEVKEEVTAIIKTCCEGAGSVSFTTDLWTSRGQDSFISLTVHSIDKDWYYHRWTPYAKYFPNSHTGVNIKLVLDEMIDSLGLATPVSVLQETSEQAGTNREATSEQASSHSTGETVLPPPEKYVINDNAANAKLAIKLSPHLIQVLCGNHTIQLSIKDTLDEVAVGTSLMKTVISKGKAQATFVKQSGPAQQAVKGACKKAKIKYTTLKNSNETRWNSTKTNLSSIIKLKLALLLLANEDTSGMWDGKLWTPSEWKLAEAADKILEIPLLTTKMWEAEKTPTMNLVVSELYSMKHQLQKIVERSNCRYAREFANVLMENLEERFPNCLADDKLRAFANYLDPCFKGVHLEALGTLQQTKKELVKKWDEEGATDEAMVDNNEEGCDDDNLNPTAQLLRARKSSGGKNSKRVESKIIKEMEFYENVEDTPIKLEELETNGDRLKWWKSTEKILPTLAKAARHVLGVPCSSSKSERVFSTGGQIVTARRVNLKPERVENLIVLKENREKAEDFMVTTTYQIKPEKNAFKLIRLERDESNVVEETIPASSVFNEEVNSTFTCEYSDSESESGED